MRIKIIIFISFFAINSTQMLAQTLLVIEGTVVNNTEPGMWEGVNIPRNAPTALSYRNNSITSVNSSGYMFQAGDEGIGSSNNNLDGEVITGNKLIWNGTDVTSITHGIFTGYNINAIIKYNYLDKVPMSIVRKSNGMTDLSGVVAYNIIKNPIIGIVMKGMNGIKIYNNTFYSSKTTSETGRGLVDIYANNSFSPAIPSAGTKIKNNIFYTKYQILNIQIYESEDLPGFESDYNLFYCEAGTPMFNYLGSVKTFAQWQALGYDTHSKVINPNFTNVNDLVPGARLDYGVNLGTTLQTGLSTNASWNVGVSPATTNQNGTWQVGARIYDAVSINLSYVGSIVENATPTILEMTYSQSLANIVPATSAFKVQVNSVDRPLNSVAIVAGKVRLTLASSIVYGDNVTVTYIKPASNQLQSATSDQAASFTAQPVVNNCLNIKPVVIITSPDNNSTFTAPATITITAYASDIDGAISKVEFLNGSTKLGESTTAPYSYSWTNVNSGIYKLTAIATDNSNATTSSSSIELNVVRKGENAEIVSLFPNPNAGDFKIEILYPLESENNKISIINLTGEKVYEEILPKNETTRHFNLYNLNSGIYILMIVGEKILVTKKFIKI